MSFSEIGYEEAMRRAGALVPVLRERVGGDESRRQMWKETEADLHRTGLFRFHQPRRWGGMELPFVADSHTTWVETAAGLGKSQVAVQTALEERRQALPFRLRGLDSDNGSECINQHLWDSCQAQEIQCTRGRPYKKDDNAHIEQTNWTHVRTLLGYVRYDSPAAQAAIQALDRGELPSVTLLRKERVGARVRRRYDAPQTPLDRVLACPEIPAAVAAQLRRQRAHLDPFALGRAIEQHPERIYALANPRHSPAPAPPGAAPTTPAPVPRRVRTRLSINPNPPLGRPARPVTSKTAR